MSHVRTTRRRRFLAGLGTLALAMSAVPLLAPTCGGGAEGTKVFARNSLIIPMDVCYQCTRQDAAFDATTSNCTRTGYTTPTAAQNPSYSGQPCPQALAQGDVVKAYGLIYQLIRNDIAVYWLIDPTKTKLDGYDLAIQYDGGFPVLKYDWASGQPGAAPTAASNHTVRYMGGPFVIDGSDYARATAVLQRYRSTFGAVNVHVSNVAFSAYVKKTMAGGWSAGGATPPKLALLDIGSGNLQNRTPVTVNDPKNAEPVISGYLAKAGIGGGAAAGSAAGPHGEIYDKLGIDDFQPAAGSTDWRTSRFGQNGYQILWVPHWVAPGSCSDFSTAATCASTLYSTNQVQQVLKTIGSWAAEGHDVFAECAGLGSFEGAFSAGSNTAYAFDYKQGDPSTRFQTPTGVRYNVDVDPVASGRQLPTAIIPGSYSSPLLQVGDYPFVPVTGAIEDYRPPDATNYLPGVERLIQASNANFTTWDFFTLRPAASGRGTTVYLAGHSYSGVQGAFQVAGSRLVLNTLFNLGAGCTETGVTCNTGLLGVCAKGVLTCGPAGQPVCSQLAFPTAETCNGLDDDCDGLVDEDLEESCYDGPAATRDVGQCRSGLRACVKNADGTFGFSACVNQVQPTPEVCNALDDDCDGQVDENLQQACYFGPSNTLDPVTGQPQGLCKAGRQVCTAGSFGDCKVCPAGIQPGAPGYADCQILPAPEVCLPGAVQVDENCDGVVNETTAEGCGQCTAGATLACYTGPAGTSGVGLCHAGTQTCTAAGSWGPCVGEITPKPEACDAALADENCNGVVDENCGCAPGSTEACYTGTAGTLGVGVCASGARACQAGVFTGACVGQTLPNVEICDGKDNNCDGTADENPDTLCTDGFTCEKGVCVPKVCGTELACPEGYACTGGTCKQSTCGGVTCAPGQECRYGSCADPCLGVTCGAGSTCASGSCVGGACYFTGCPSGAVCLQGECRADACTGLTCPAGTFCRQGDCVQSCAAITCPSGQKCGVDGFCLADACSGKSCGPSQRCVNGACTSDPCLGVGCGQGQVCSEGLCVDDPCTGVSCPVGACVAGQCFASGTPKPAPEVPGKGGDGAGCGCAGGAASPFSFLLLALALPLARRRRAARADAGRGPPALLLVLCAAVALAGTACQKKESFDPATCALTCEGENRCIDVTSDPSHCGSCGTACGAGEVCLSPGTCWPSATVAPFVRSVSPGSAPKGGLAPVTLDVLGERFAAGATLRGTTPAGTRTFTTTFVDAGHVRADLDLVDAQAATMFVRVVNPDRVISNAVRFDVTVPSPAITAVTPNSITIGSPAEVLVAGTGFFAASRCHLRGPTLNETVLLSILEADGLRCTVDATLLLPGTGYRLWVVNEAAPTPVSSGEFPLTLVSQTPVVLALSPSSGGSNAIVDFTVTGTGFDVTSAVLFDGVAVPTTYIDTTRLVVAQFGLPSTAGARPVQVRNGAATLSNSLSFAVGSPPPNVSTFSPATVFQGDNPVTLAFTGANLPLDARIEIQPPGGAFRSLASNATATQVTATGASFIDNPRGTAPEGAWSARLVSAGSGASSSTWPFRVLSNQAVLREAAPRGEAQGRSVPVTLTATNVRPDATIGTVDKGVRVRFSGAQADLVPTSLVNTAGTWTIGATLSTTGLETGSYALQVVNPRFAAPSNGLSFQVTPGLPSLATQGGVCLATPTTSCVATVRQQEARVPIRIAGTNFAKPDPAGNGATTIVISAPTLGVTDFALPAADVTVTSATRIDVALDTRIAVPGLYSVQAWNPGGPTPPQKSNLLVGVFEILP